MRVPGHRTGRPSDREARDRRGQGGGKGSTPSVTSISYRLSFALAIVKARFWALAVSGQMARRLLPTIEHARPLGAHEGPDPRIWPTTAAQEKRVRRPCPSAGIADAVFEEMGLEKWEPCPQLSFEVTRAAKQGRGLSREVEAVAMIPGTGEYSLATTPVSYDFGQGDEDHQPQHRNGD